MKNEFIIINKTTLEEKLNSLKEQREREPDNYEKSYLNGMIKQLEFMLSQSTPLSPESIKPLQELIDEGYDPYDSAHHLQVQRMLKVIKDYISNLKLDI